MKRATPFCNVSTWQVLLNGNIAFMIELSRINVINKLIEILNYTK